MSTSRPAHVRDWLKGLGALVASTVGPQEVQAKLNAYVPMLLQEFDVSHFTAAALRAVARQCEYLPSYKTLCDLLKAHIEEQAIRAVNASHRALPAPPPEPPRPPPTEAERQAVAAQMAELRRDLAAKAVAREAAEALQLPRVQRAPRPALAPSVLAAGYARVADDPNQPDNVRAIAATRLQMLREREAPAP